jgi:hypothetical protein
MKWFWLLVIVASVASLVASDEAKRKRWRSLADDANGPTYHRVTSLLNLAVAAWQSVVLWWPR